MGGHSCWGCQVHEYELLHTLARGTKSCGGRKAEVVLRFLANRSSWGWGTIILHTFIYYVRAYITYADILYRVNHNEQLLPISWIEDRDCQWNDVPVNSLLYSSHFFSQKRLQLGFLIKLLTFRKAVPVTLSGPLSIYLSSIYKVISWLYHLGQCGILAYKRFLTWKLKSTLSVLFVLKIMC